MEEPMTATLSRNNVGPVPFSGGKDIGSPSTMVTPERDADLYGSDPSKKNIDFQADSKQDGTITKTPPPRPENSDLKKKGSLTPTSNSTPTSAPISNSSDDLKNLNLKPMQPIHQRNRVVSLDRKGILYVEDEDEDEDLEGNVFDSSSSSESVDPPTMSFAARKKQQDSWNNQRLGSTVHRRLNVAEVASSESDDHANKSDDDTSDGETSYFSGQLPSPKSAMRQGYGNNNAISQYHRKSPTASGLPGQPFRSPSTMKSMPTNFRFGNPSGVNSSRKSWQESDASLSLSPSCSSDDEHEHDKNVFTADKELSPEHYVAERSNSVPSLKHNLVRSSNENEILDDFCDLKSRGTVPLPRKNSDMSSHVSHSSDEDEEGAGPPIAVSVSDGAVNRSERTRGHRRDISALTDSSDILRSLSGEKNSSFSGCEQTDTDENSSFDSTSSPVEIGDHLGVPNLHPFHSTGITNHSIAVSADRAHLWKGENSDCFNSVDFPREGTFSNESKITFVHNHEKSLAISDSSEPSQKYSLKESSNSTLQMNQIHATSQDTHLKYSDDDEETVESLGWNVDFNSSADINEYTANVPESGGDLYSHKGNGKFQRKGGEKNKKKMGESKESNSKNRESHDGSEDNSSNDSSDLGMMKGKNLMQSDDPSHGNSDLVVNEGEFLVYRTRWLMLFYISILNLLSDWTCYSIAPIALLTCEAFGEVDPELLVTIFLGANAFATACEPIILSRLGLRRTILFGALLLMIGSAIKSGGIPWIIGTSLQKGQGDWRVYTGFFLVGLSQPLYQCTPALLSASWFPEKERTMATGVALNSNQLGIGCAFIFGTLLVHTSDDIPSYFGLLSIVSTMAFVGCALQFDDAPPTPPSNTARVMRGTVEINLPSFGHVRGMISSTLGFPSNKMSSYQEGKEQITSSVRSYPNSVRSGSQQNSSGTEEPFATEDASPKKHSRRKQKLDRKTDSTRTEKKSSRNRTSRRTDGNETRNRRGKGSRTASSENGFRAGPMDLHHPSMGIGNESTRNAALAIADIEKEAEFYGCAPPSAMWSQEGMPGQSNGNYRQQNVAQRNTRSRRQRNSSRQQNIYDEQNVRSQEQVPHMANYQQYDYNLHQLDSNIETDSPFSSLRNQGPQPMYGYQNQPNMQPHYNPAHTPHLSMPRGYNTMNEQPWSPYHQHPQFYSQYGPVPMHYPNQMGYQYYPQPFYHPYQIQQYSPNMAQFSSARNKLPQLEDPIDEGVEPVLVQAGHKLDIDIRDDQILLSIRACFSRPGFVQSLLAFVVSAIVINTLSTFMDYLVRLGGSGSEFVGIIGGSFQILIMISSLIFGQITDTTRAYFSIVLMLLVLGAFALAECGVNLDAARGTDLKWTLLVTAVLVGPLQPVATELGVEVAYPLSENTVLVIQQLFANLMSALFIPCFKAAKDIGREPAIENEINERPQYTFSFYLLIVIHACSTVLFSTFNGHYLRLDHELEEKNRDAQNDESLNYESSNYVSSDEWLVSEPVYKDPSENANHDANAHRPLLV